MISNLRTNKFLITLFVLAMFLSSFKINASGKNLCERHVEAYEKHFKQARIIEFIYEYQFKLNDKGNLRYWLIDDCVTPEQVNLLKTRLPKMTREEYELISFSYKKNCPTKNKVDCKKRSINALAFLKSLGLVTERSLSNSLSFVSDTRYRESDLDKTSRVVICCMMDKKQITDISGVICSPGSKSRSFCAVNDNGPIAFKRNHRLLEQTNEYCRKNYTDSELCNGFEPILPLEIQTLRQPGNYPKLERTRGSQPIAN